MANQVSKKSGIVSQDSINDKAALTAAADGDPLPVDRSADSPDPEVRPPRRRRKPFNFSTAIIAVLVAVSATLVYRRDGMDGVLEILNHDLWLFGGILPRVLAGCTLGAFVAEMLPQEKVSAALGANSGFRGLLIGGAFGALLPGGPFTAYPIASALLTVGADFGAVISMVTAWLLVGYGRAISWELPIMGADFTLWRIVSCLPIPILAGALGRFVYVRFKDRIEA